MKIEGALIGEFFNAHKFEDIYLSTMPEWQALMPKEEFLNEARHFHQGTIHFSLYRENELEPGVRRYAFVDDKTKRMLTVAVKQSLIIGLKFGYLEQYHEYKVPSKVTYRLPFKDDWFVLFGGEDNFLNYHYSYENQRYAYDFIVKENGYAVTGNASLLESYHSYGRPIVAPASGTIFKVFDGVRDNTPMSMNMDVPEGNAIIIQHGVNEYSLLAHLKADSILVSEGPYVNRGQILAACGNSGASDTPHLHFHVMDGPNPDTARSLKIKFEHGIEPEQGQTLRGE